MAVTPKKMGLGTLTNAEVTQYTAAAAEVLSNILLTNLTAAIVQVSVSVVPSGGTASDANRIVKNLDIPANGIIQLDTLRVVMATNDFISAICSANSSVTMRSNGVTL